MKRKYLNKQHGLNRHIKVIRCSCLLLAVWILLAVCAIVFLLKTPPADSRETQEVYASAETGVMANETLTSEGGIVSTGISGVVNGISETRSPDCPIRKIGSNCEAVIVGQRASQSMGGIQSMDTASSMQSSVENLNAFSQTQASEAEMMSDADYETLLRIVEAEAGGEDMKSKVLVANVIMNRVKDSHFPNNVVDVVWECTDGAAQFSPTEDGRIDSVEISDKTEQAVKQALEGLVYSDEALYFVAKDQALESNVAWFESDLKPLFEHGSHAFYTLPDEE